MENLELELVPATTATSVLSKAVRTVLAIAILGSVTAYAAISVEPQLVDYLSFIPGMEPAATQCSTQACGSCGMEGSCSAACEVDYGCCSTDSETCDLSSVTVVSEEPSSEAADTAVDTAAAEESVEVVGTSEQ